MAVRRRVQVSGRVQGVFFRESCARQARAAGLTGWVRNRPDGRVEAVFEGDQEPVERLVSWCGHGPSRAVVTGVEVFDEQPEGGSGFRTW
jgi:acylphosphatase